MNIQFRREVYSSVFRDPRQNFEPVEASTEIRYDPVTGEMTRVFPFKQFRLVPHNWSPVVDVSREKGCPFCPEVIASTTPLFPEELIPGGRLCHGEATVVPNISPYAAYAGVVVMCKQHYYPLTAIPAAIISDALSAGISFLKRVKDHDAQNGRYGSICWNYMPYSGGSIIHPHLQALAGPAPGNLHHALLEGAQAYHRDNGRNIWADLLEAEKTSGQRYLGQLGSQHWLASFAARGVGDLTVIFQDKSTLEELTVADLQHFTAGLQKVLAYYGLINLPSFNLAFYPAPQQDAGYWLTARIVGRFTLFQWTSDINALQMLLGDFFTIYPPEQLAAEIRADFSDSGTSSGG